MDLDELVHQLRAEKADCLARAAHFAEGAHRAENEAAVLAARIQGIEEARAALAAGGANGAAKAPLRAPRRDIRALVTEYFDKAPHLLALPNDQRVAVLSRNLKCRPSQIEVTLRAIERTQPGSDAAVN